jgi:four helix bundle protein
MRDFRKIEAWQLADDLAVAVYRLSRGFPKEEAYGLTNQIRRSAVSTPANIVEGSARETKKDYLHFLHISRGSLAETQYFIHLARRLEYVAVPEADQVEELSRRAYACLHGLIKAVEKEI